MSSQLFGTVFPETEITFMGILNLDSEKEDVIKVGALVISIVGASLMILTGLATQSSAGWINLNIGVFAPSPVVVAPAPPPAVVYAPPPAYVIQEPHSMVVIPGTYVYAVPDSRANIVFYQGYWWRPYGGHWYRAANYNGTWVHVGSEGVPHAVITH